MLLIILNVHDATVSLPVENIHIFVQRIG